MSQTRQGDSPQNIGSPDIIWSYFFSVPNKLFPGTSPAPPPAVLDFELVEETVGVFQNLIYNESGGGNDGQIVVTNV